MADYSTNITTSGTTWTILPSQGSRPEKAPKALVATKAVQTQDGWLGQVFVDTKIAWESAGYEDSEDAIDAANAVVVRAVANLIVAAGQEIAAEAKE